MCFGKGDEKFGVGGFAFYTDGAAVELHHPLDHRQADAVALAVVGAVRLVELAEKWPPAAPGGYRSRCCRWRPSHSFSVSRAETSTVWHSGENLMALSSRFIHTCRSSSWLPETVYSSRSRFISRFFFSHFRSSSSTQVRSCSERLKGGNVRQNGLILHLGHVQHIGGHIRQTLTFAFDDVQIFQAAQPGSGPPAAKGLQSPQ